MTTDSNGRWFTFLAALVALLLTAIGAMNLFITNQLWAKLDRMTSLFMEEKRILMQKNESICDRLEKQGLLIKELEIKARK